ncbi:RNA polymerase II transcription factor B subunit 2 [Mycena sanguinolenta]|uniref:RNA polymerase II transcription factor B subunit 2 n=1 Tax=Mycena sanguinolenta TaxID=230812 RepID=A0A8H6ZFG5_9AGAR|nr:RNA polymerase II transcription factor B subunit 2 [Mycena sanguinolenta]
MPSLHLNAPVEPTSSPHSLLPFLQSQSQQTLNKLYSRPSSCLSIFRLLAPLQQQIIMNLLWLESTISSSTMAAWVVREEKKTYDAALSPLFRLHILATSPIKLALNPTFKTSMRQALTGGGTTGSFGVPAPKDDKYPAMGIDELDGYALERWETILHYMVSSGSGQNSMRPSKAVLYLLQQSGLMANSQGALQITSAGFQFLLHSPHAQLWDLLLQYLRLAEERNMDLVEVLSFLFMLSTMELGREYSTEGMNTTPQVAATHKAMLNDLRDYGLLWQRKSSSRRFYPTRLATTLTSSSPPLPTSTGPSSGPKEGFIVLETNYRIYAYTDNPLQTAVLNLFVSLKTDHQLSNCSCAPTNEKKMYVLSLRTPRVLVMPHSSQNPLLPVTVQDQIRLWELEKNRLKSQEGYLYTAFTSPADYELVLNYAKQLKLVLWENAAKRCFFGSLDGHANIKNFIERRTGGNT